MESQMLRDEIDDADSRKRAQMLIDVAGNAEENTVQMQLV